MSRFVGEPREVNTSSAAIRLFGVPEWLPHSVCLLVTLLPECYESTVTWPVPS